MLRNLTRTQEIMPRAKKARGYLGMLRGMMFRSQKSMDYALVFELPFSGTLTSSVHMLFVFFPLDIVFLDAGKKVVDVRNNVQPFTPSIVPKAAAHYFIEMPAGKAKDIRTGDQLAWDY